MKAYLKPEGHLVIEPETEQEQNELRIWEYRNKPMFANYAIVIDYSI